MEAALVILDGWALADHDRRDAVRAATTPTFDRCWDAGAAGSLAAWGERVGLPADGMGNSEVGHLTIGAGRVVPQARTRIDEAIEAGEFARNDALDTAYRFAADHDGRIHLLGLASDAGVHGDIEHLEALIELATIWNIDAVTHAFTDGRDTSPTAAVEYLTRLNTAAETAGTGGVGTVSGRYFAMDRDGHWDRTEQVYDAIVHNEADHRVESAVRAVEAAYDRGETDEFIEPTLVNERPALQAGDAVVTANFRADRMRQLSRLLADIDPPVTVDPPATHVVTMTEYDETFDLPVAFPTNQPEATLGEVLATNGLTQLRIAETEKYAHVTYFLNGGRERVFSGEHREIVASPDVPTYDEQPEMSAPGVTDRAIEITEAEDPTLLVLNYANPDMVGHTGDFEATVTAVEAVDAQLARLLATMQSAGAHVIITADHGNADDLGTAESPQTAHTFNPVPFVYLAPDGGNAGFRVRNDGGLADITPTLLTLLGVDQPEAMTGESLLV